MLDQSPQLFDEALGQRLDSPLGVYFVAVGPLRLKSPASHTAVYLYQILAPAEQTARPAGRAALEGEGECQRPEALRRLSRLLEEVLRLRKVFQLPGGSFLGAGIPEQAGGEEAVSGQLKELPQ